jgi:hypothetical protein
MFFNVQIKGKVPDNRRKTTTNNRCYIDLASAKTSTRAAPPFRRARLHSHTVEPVVTTSSINRTDFPSTRAGSFRENAPVRFFLRWAPVNLVCAIVGRILRKPSVIILSFHVGKHFFASSRA